MGNATIQYSTYDFLFNFNRNYASYLVPFSRYSRFADSDPPHLHLAPPQGVTQVEFCRDLWHQKTRVPKLSCGVVCVILSLAVLVELSLVMDGRTQGHG